MRRDRLTDREMFAARPWRAADRSQMIVAVVESPVPSPSGGWRVVLATLDGAPLYSKPIEAQRTPGSFTEAELQSLFEESLGRKQA